MPILTCIFWAEQALEKFLKKIEKKCLHFSVVCDSI